LKEEHLPSRRTFLLRLSSAAEPRAGIYRGRIEHIPTGKTARFDSLRKIDDFVQEVMATENGREPITHITDEKQGETPCRSKE
jgi:hypothetical protein